MTSVLRRPRRSSVLLVVLASVAMFVRASGATAASPGGGTTTCTSIDQLVPQQSDQTVNQGVGTYSPLAAGKQTLVRAYLSLPSCADEDDSIVVTDARLEYAAHAGGAPAFSGVVDAPTPPLPATGVSLPPASAAPVGGRSPSDPIFVMRGDQLPPATSVSGAGFDVAYQLRVTYQASLNGAPLSAPQTVLLEPFSASFAPKQRPVNVLLVPLVDGNETDPNRRFPPAVVETVVAAMDTLNRELPVASGVRNDFIEVAGIRYAFHPTGLDLRHVGPTLQQPLGQDLLEDGTYCGKENTLLRRELNKLRAVYNGVVNYTKGAVFDRVLGIVPSTIVSSTCTIAGYADYPGTAGYIVADPAKSNSGSLATLEIAHTLHLVDPNSPNSNAELNDPAHSKNTEADFADRAFDTHALTALGSTSDRSVMRYTTDSAWRDDATLLEEHEYRYALCRLSPGNVLGSLSCPDPATPGGTAADSGERFAIVGETDGTPAGTIADSHVQPDGVADVTDDASAYRLLVLGPGGILANYGVPVTETHSHHGDDHDGTTHAATVSFGISVPSQDGSRFELWYGDPQTSPDTAVLLYARDRNAPPTITETSSTSTIGDAVNATSSPDVDDQRPSLSPDGSLLAWRSAEGMRLVDLASGGEPSLPFDGTEAAWSKDGSRLAWTTASGEVLVGDVDRSSATPTIANVEPIYFPTGGGLTFPATGVSWSPDGASVVSSIDGDLWNLPADPMLFLTPACAAAPVDVCPRLTDTDGAVESDPDWSHHGPIAYARDAGVWTLDPDAAATTQAALIADAADPTWGHEQLAFTRGSAVWVSRVTSAGATAAAAVITDAAQPSFSDDATRVAFASVTATPRDVYVAGSTTRTTTVETTDDDPSTLRLSLIAECPELDDALLAFAHPISVDSTGATFEVTHDTSDVCAGATFRVDVSDGVSVTDGDAGHGGTDHEPVPAISTPFTSATILQHRALALVGGVSDVDGDADEEDLVWSLVAPDGSASSGVATGPNPDALLAPAGGWQAGAYVVELTATDAAGNRATTSRAVTVLEDQDDDGIPGSIEAGPCFDPGADTDASNAYGDPDADGFVNVIDDEPCEALDTVVVDFDPDTLYVPSSGNPVTVTVPGNAFDVSSIDPATVRISRIGAWTIHQPALSYEVDKRGNGVVKFDRQDLTTFLADKGYVGGYVRITVSWSAAGVTHHGADPNSPITSPS